MNYQETLKAINAEARENLGNVPDGTYIEHAGKLLPVVPTDGYWVAVNTALRGGRRAPFIGVWTAKDGEVFVDQTRWIADRDKAIKLGKIHDQYAIWDCANGVEVVL
jgi:hypothetical protein